eukprot:gene2341-16053_t
MLRKAPHQGKAHKKQPDDYTLRLCTRWLAGEWRALWDELGASSSPAPRTKDPAE